MKKLFVFAAVNIFLGNVVAGARALPAALARRGRLQRPLLQSLEWLAALPVLLRAESQNKGWNAYPIFVWLFAVQQAFPPRALAPRLLLCRCLTSPAFIPRGPPNALTLNALQAAVGHAPSVLLVFQKILVRCLRRPALPEPLLLCAPPGSIFNSLKTFISQPTGAVEVVGAAIPATSRFFMAYVLLKARRHPVGHSVGRGAIPWGIPWGAEVTAASTCMTQRFRVYGLGLGFRV